MQVNKIVKEYLLSITLSDLRKVGVFSLKNNESIDCVIKKNGRSNGITITYHQDGEKRSLEFDYIVNRESVNYFIELAVLPNALTDRGSIYMVCPITGKVCRKLYLHEKYFQHFSSIDGIIYFRSLLSHQQREQYSEMKTYYKLEQLVSARGTKYFRTHFRQQLTQKHRKAMQAYHQLQQIATTNNTNV